MTRSRRNPTKHPTTTKKTQRRFGIGEWYGRSFVSLTSEERAYYASIQLKTKKSPQACPFLSRLGKPVNCWKPGGICSLRSYEKSATGVVDVNSGGSTLRTTCPSRFDQDDIAYRWIGEVLLQDPGAVPIDEVPFLQRLPKIAETTPNIKREVGRIDKILVVPNSNPLRWAPVEKQAVYFSGRKMELDFRYIAKSRNSDLPFPLVNRRPDYRSSGPKRLMPQLEVKVPTLRTWGKKMAVIVDEDFFSALGPIAPANDLSNAEIVWFIVRYAEQTDGSFQLAPGRTFMTTLEESIRGLVAAVPMPLPQFESAILRKIAEKLAP